MILGNESTKQLKRLFLINNIQEIEFQKKWSKFLNNKKAKEIVFLFK